MTKEPAQGLMNTCSRQLDKWISMIFSIIVVINQIMCYNNLVVISPSEKWPISTHRSPHKVDPIEPTYTRDQLFNMSSKLKQSKYCILPFKTKEIIQKYKINKWPRKLVLNRKIPQTKINTGNLVQVKLNSETCRNKSNNIRLATINVRSIKNKVEQIIKTSSLENTDFTILM